MRPKVLLVDDEPHVTEALKRVLRKMEYQILTACSAREALQRLAQEPVDVIVSDEQMPGMSGSELLALVRRHYPQTMRIILTGHASLEAAVRAINEGEISRFLEKPCNEQELTHAIEHALQQQERLAEHKPALADAERRPALLRELEKEVPGITKVHRDASGAIILEEPGVDLEVLVQTINAAVAQREG
ncbi:MAG TPA: response regulator [Methylomirabilota bacterium]|jgi:DNA-binding NtrC family response regulator|nr:response regulator [Methylomirabilota bacterium]